MQLTNGFVFISTDPMKTKPFVNCIDTSVRSWVVVWCCQ